MEDGLLVLKRRIDIRSIAALIERTARWVDPETFKLLPVWYPEFARRGALYNANWSIRRQNTNWQSGDVTDKIEGNTQANKALCEAMGITLLSNRAELFKGTEPPLPMLVRDRSLENSDRRSKPVDKRRSSTSPQFT